MFVLFALFETGQVYTGRIPKSQPTLSKPSLREHLYASVKQSFDGFSDSVGVFTLALPFSILAEFFSREDGVQYKDFRVAGWVLAYIMSLAVWLYRIGRLFRRVDTYRLVGGSDLSTDKKVKKEFTFLLLAVSSFPGLFFLFFLVVISLVFRYVGDMTYPLFNFLVPFRFEDFWDDICGFSYKSDEIWLAVVAFVLILWCVLREFILAIGAELTKRRIRQRQTVAQAPQPTIARVFSVLDKRVRADPKYQTWALVLGLVDAIVVGVWTWIIFYRYNHYRRQLLDYANSGNKNTWSLGQVFALASVIPIGIGFLRGMCPLIWYCKLVFLFIHSRFVKAKAKRHHQRQGQDYSLCQTLVGRHNPEEIRDTGFCAMGILNFLFVILGEVVSWLEKQIDLLASSGQERYEILAKIYYGA